MPVTDPPRLSDSQPSSGRSPLDLSPSSSLPLAPAPTSPNPPSGPWWPDPPGYLLSSRGLMPWELLSFQAGPHLSPDLWPQPRGRMCWLPPRRYYFSGVRSQSPSLSPYMAALSVLVHSMVSLQKLISAKC